MPDKSHDVARRLAGLELNLLRQIDALPAPTFEGAKIAEAGTPVYDINGELLFYRFPLAKRGATPSFADIAAHPAFGAPLLAVSAGLAWNAGQLGRLKVQPVIAKDALKFPPIKLYKTKELHYSDRAADHHTCYELRSQETNVWCVGASTQMLLDFYRYNYTQDRIATQLGLGTKASPNGLPYARVGDVVTAIE